MRAVHIGIGHDEDLMVADFANIKLVADAGVQRSHDGHQLVVAVDTVRAGLFEMCIRDSFWVMPCTPRPPRFCAW